MATEQRVEGGVSPDAAYTIYFFQDDKGKPVEKEDATGGKYIEYTEEGIALTSNFFEIRQDAEASNTTEP